MFDGGKNTRESQEKNPALPPQADDASIRIFSMPEALRERQAVFREETKKEQKKEELQPIIIPIALPPEKPQDVVLKRRISPVLISLVVLLLMVGTGAGVWWYVVTYATPQQIVSVVPDPKPDPQPDPLPKDPYPGTDTDSDGLTNVEELLYGTDFRSPDTDGDTFLDGNEVFHRYDPNGLAPSTLLDTGAVRVLERSEVPFTLYYPASWTVSVLPEATQVNFRLAGGSSFSLVYEAKDALTDLSAWMKTKSISTKDTEETLTKEGYPARIGHDGRMMYLDLGDWVVSATYDLGDGLSIDFLQTFKMMTNSILLTDKVITPFGDVVAQ